VRVGPALALAVAAVFAGACSAGDRTSFDTRVTTSTSTPVAPSTTAAPASSTTTTAAPAGSVTFRVSGVTLPDVRSGGTGLRVLVRSSSERLNVRRRGGGGAVSVCPIALAIPSPTYGGCVDLPADGGVEVVFLGGLEARATATAATVEELAISYVPATRAITVVTPARPAGACQERACEATFSLAPARAGAFVLDGQAGGGRPRLVLTAVGAGVSNRTLATVEGGGSLSIRATLEAGSEARLLHQEQGTGPVAPVTAEILWP
jgi:hypothetical protein